MALMHPPAASRGFADSRLIRPRRCGSCRAVMQRSFYNVLIRRTSSELLSGGGLPARTRLWSNPHIAHAQAKHLLHVLSGPALRMLYRGKGEAVCQDTERIDSQLQI